MAIMKWVKGKINIGHVLTMVLVVFAVVSSSVATYYTIKNTGKANTVQIKTINSKLESLNTRVRAENQSWDDLIIRLDQRYVNQNEYDDFRDNLNRTLRYIREDTQYLRNKLDDR